MAERVRLRELTTEEQNEVDRLARSRKEEARMMMRAKLVLLAQAGHGATVISKQVGLVRPHVLKWIKRFNKHGLAGLQDEPRSGRPPTYSTQEVSEVVATALTAPKALEQPFASWTLDRLEIYLNEVKKIDIKRSRIGEILAAEGLRWRKQETWFGERVDPEFAQKRGSLNSSTRSPRRIAS